MGAAFSWAAGNIVARRAGQVDMLSYVVWASNLRRAAAVRVIMDYGRPAGDGRGRQRARQRGVTWAAVVWQAVGNTMFGYGVWGWLLARYPAATVAPLALLVPIFGMTSAAVPARRAQLQVGTRRGRARS